MEVDTCFKFKLSDETISNLLKFTVDQGLIRNQNNQALASVSVPAPALCPNGLPVVFGAIPKCQRPDGGCLCDTGLGISSKVMDAIQKLPPCETCNSERVHKLPHRGDENQNNLESPKGSTDYFFSWFGGLSGILEHKAILNPLIFLTLSQLGDNPTYGDYLPIFELIIRSYGFLEGFPPVKGAGSPKSEVKVPSDEERRRRWDNRFDEKVELEPPINNCDSPSPPPPGWSTPGYPGPGEIPSMSPDELCDLTLKEAFNNTVPPTGNEPENNQAPKTESTSQISESILEITARIRRYFILILERLEQESDAEYIDTAAVFNECLNQALGENRNEQVRFALKNALSVYKIGGNLDTKISKEQAKAVAAGIRSTVALLGICCPMGDEVISTVVYE